MNLSVQQRSILRWLLESVLAIENSDEEMGVRLAASGIEWLPEVTKGDREGCRRASISRAIRRLERRGLIKRVCGPKKRRTTALQLTELGRRVATRLSSG